MSTGPDPKQGSPEVQTFEMPKPPPPLPEDPEDRKPAKASASHWVILFFLSLIAALALFYTFYYGPKLEAERAAAEAAANYVRPWPERAEEAILTTFEGEGGHELAASIQLILEPEGSGAKLQGIDFTPTQENLVSLFRISWNKAAVDEQAAPTLAVAEIKWTSADRRNIGVELVPAEGAPATDEAQAKELQKLFSTEIHPLVRRNTADK
jgi:hypothetical protein